MNWSVAITEASAYSFREDLESAFTAAFPDAPEPVKAQFGDLADAADRLVQAGHVGDHSFSATLQGYVTAEGEPSTSNSVGFSVIGQNPAHSE